MLPINHEPTPANCSILQLAGRLRAALPYLLYATVLATTCHARDHYSAALDRFISSTPEEFLSRLNRERPPVLNADLRARVIAALPAEGEAKRLTINQQRKLDSLGAVLRAHAREGFYTLKVVEGRQARIGLHARFVVLITETALTALSTIQLQAAVAHEIGHEYVWGEFETARRSGDWGRLRELELFCDGMAAVTLAQINADPAQWIAALERLYAEDRERGIVYATENGYPSLEERRQFIKQVRKWLLAGGRRWSGALIP